MHIFSRIAFGWEMKRCDTSPRNTKKDLPQQYFTEKSVYNLKRTGFENIEYKTYLDSPFHPAAVFLQDGKAG